MTDLVWLSGTGNVYAKDAWDTFVGETTIAASLAPADTLVADGGTLDIAGGTLDGDTLTIGEDVPFAPVILNLSADANVNVDVISVTNNLTVNVKGVDTLVLANSPSGSFNNADTIINIAATGHLFSTDTLAFGKLVVNGGANATDTFANSSFDDTPVILNTNIGGDLTDDFGSLTINGKVVVGASINLYGASLTLERPADFAGVINITTSDSFVDLRDLDSNAYRIKGDILSLFNGNKIVDALTLNYTNPYDPGLTVEKNRYGILIAPTGEDRFQNGGVGRALKFHT